MKKLLVAFVALALLPIELPRAQPAAGPDIRLVLLIAVDQFGYDYLTRFRNNTPSGFKRLSTEGAVFTNANLEHYPTVTAVGHATMLSGATPSVSGIIGNDWFDRASAARSPASPIARPSPVGSAPVSAASPRRLLVSTIGDEFKSAAALPRGRRTRRGRLACRSRIARRFCLRAEARRRLLVGQQDRPLRHEHLLHGECPGMGPGIQRPQARRYVCRARPWTPLAVPALTLRQFPAEPGAACTRPSTEVPSATPSCWNSRSSCCSARSSAGATRPICCRSASPPTTRSGTPMAPILPRSKTSPCARTRPSDCC